MTLYSMKSTFSLRLWILTVPLLLSAPPTASSAPSPSMSGMTPPALLEIVRSDIESGDADSAASKFMVAMAYSFYDARRSSGNASRETFADMTALALADLAADKLGAFAAAGRSLSSQPQKISSLLTAAGRPSYDLSYLGEASAPREGFNPESAWSEIVSGLSRPQLVPR